MKNLFELGVRLIVLFYLLLMINPLIGIIDYIITGIMEYDTLPFDYYSAFKLVVFIIGVIVFLKPNILTKFVKINDDEIKISIENEQLLRVGLILLGVYFLINSTTNITALLMRLANIKDIVKNDVYISPYYISIIINAIFIFISFILVRKSKKIANFLLKDKSQ